MDVVSFYKMDVFFMVTTILAVLLGSLLATLMFYAIRITRDVSEITARVRKETEEIVNEVDEVCESITDGVDEVRDGVAQARAYTKALARIGVVQTFALFFKTLAEASPQPETVRQPRRRVAKKRRARLSEISNA